MENEYVEQTNIDEVLPPNAEADAPLAETEDAAVETEDTPAVTEAEPVSEDAADAEPVAEGRFESKAVQRQRAVQSAARRESRSARNEETLQFAEFTREAGRAVDRKHVYSGTLAGVLPATENTPTLAQVTIEQTGFTAMIQFSEFFATDPFERRSSPMAPDERHDREERLLRNSLGAQVTFVITSTAAEGEARVVVASRKEAMRLNQRLAYYGRSPIREGQIVTANIFAVERAGHTMWVELGGVECQLLPGQITYRPIIGPDDLQEMGYVAGAQVPVYVSELKLDESTHTVETLHVNAATAELAKWQRNMAKLTTPMTVQGIITRMRTNPNTGTTSAVVWLPAQQCPVRVPSMRPYTTNIGPGSPIVMELFRENHEDSEGIWFYGRARQIRPRPSMYNG